MPLQLPITFNERFVVISVQFFTADSDLPDCKLDNVTFKPSYLKAKWVHITLAVPVKLIYRTVFGSVSDVCCLLKSSVVTIWCSFK